MTPQSILNDLTDNDYYVISDKNSEVELTFDTPARPAVRSDRRSPRVASPSRLVIRIRANHWWRNGGLLITLLDSNRNPFKTTITPWSGSLSGQSYYNGYT